MYEFSNGYRKIGPVDHDWSPFLLQFEEPLERIQGDDFAWTLRQVMVRLAVRDLVAPVTDRLEVVLHVKRNLPMQNG